MGHGKTSFVVVDRGGRGDRATGVVHSKASFVAVDRGGRSDRAAGIVHNKTSFFGHLVSEATFSIVDHAVSRIHI